MTNKELAKVLRGRGVADTVRLQRNGTVMVKRGFFFRNGMNAKLYRDRVLRSLVGFSVRVLDFGERYTGLCTEDNVEQVSHWWVNLLVVEEIK